MDKKTDEDDHLGPEPRAISGHVRSLPFHVEHVVSAGSHWPQSPQGTDTSYPGGVVYRSLRRHVGGGGDKGINITTRSAQN